MIQERTLDKMKTLIISSNKIKKEISAMIVNELGASKIGTEYKAVAMRKGLPVFHTHVHAKPVASTTDILEMVQQRRPFTAIGSMSPFTKRPTIHVYSVNPDDFLELDRIVKIVTNHSPSSRAMTILQQTRTEFVLNVMGYQFNRKWVTYATARKKWVLGHTAPSVCPL